MLKHRNFDKHMNKLLKSANSAWYNSAALKQDDLVVADCGKSALLARQWTRQNRWTSLWRLILQLGAVVIPVIFATWCRNVLHLLPAFERILHTPRSLGLPEVTTRLSSQWRPHITLALTKQLSCTASETLMCVKLYLLLQFLSFNFRYFRSFESIQESQGLSVLGPEELWWTLNLWGCVEVDPPAWQHHHISVQLSWASGETRVPHILILRQTPCFTYLFCLKMFWRC